MIPLIQFIYTLNSRGSELETMFTHLFNRWKIFHIKFSTLNNISRVGWLKNFITLISYKWKVWKQKNMQTWGYQFFSGVTLFTSLRIVTFHAVIRFFVNFGRFLVYILLFWNLFGKLKTNYPQSIVYRFKKIVIAITPKPINRKRLCFAKKVPVSVCYFANCLRRKMNNDGITSHWNVPTFYSFFFLP